MPLTPRDFLRHIVPHSQPGVAGNGQVDRLQAHRRRAAADEAQAVVAIPPRLVERLRAMFIRRYRQPRNLRIHREPARVGVVGIHPMHVQPGWETYQLPRGLSGNSSCGGTINSHE